MTKSRWLMLALLILAFGAGALLIPGAEPPPYTQVSNQQLTELLAQGVKLVDIRRPEEWRQTGVIKGSHLITAFDGSGRLVQDFPAKLTQLARPDEPVALICRTGNRTDALGRALMQQAGYQKVYNVTHGISDWIAKGGAVCKGQPAGNC